MTDQPKWTLHSLEDEDAVWFEIHGPVDAEGWASVIASVDDAANAHLIAAAPDLYAALEAMTARMSLYSGHHDDALTAMGKAALAKARGETK